MDNFEDIFSKAMSQAQELGEEYIKLLDLEHREITKQGAEQYWIELYNSGRKFKTNKNALVFPYLLGITTINPFDGEPELMIESKDGNISDAIEIICGSDSIVVSPFTEVLTKRGWIQARNLKESDELSEENITETQKEKI